MLGVFVIPIRHLYFGVDGTKMELDRVNRELSYGPLNGMALLKEPFWLSFFSQCLSHGIEICSSVIKGPPDFLFYGLLWIF